MLQKIVRLSILLSLLGCAITTAGSEPLPRLAPVDLSQLQPGLSTRADLQYRVGVPAKITRLNEVWTNVLYQNITHDGDELNLRSLDLGFRYGILSSYHYISKYPEDSTCFDFDKARSLTKEAHHLHTQAEVIALFGKPTGIASEHSFGNDHVESYECVTRDRIMHILNIFYSTPTDVRRTYLMEWRIPEKSFR